MDEFKPEMDCMNKKAHRTEGPSSHEEAPSEQPRVRRTPPLNADVSPPAPAIAFSRIANDHLQPDLYLKPKLEDAFEFQIPLIPSILPDIRLSSTRVAPKGNCKPGWSYLIDLSAGPTRRLNTVFDNITLYINRSTINALAYDKGLHPIGGLSQPNFGAPDLIMFHLAEVLQPLLESPGLASSMFLEHIAMAFHEHVIATYGDQHPSRRLRGYGLAPRQIRLVKDFIETNLGGNPSISDLARESGLSASYFAEAFKRTTGISPHQWLLKRRVERAKAMLRDTDSSLATISSKCGFFDQSHFSRVFIRFEGSAPGDWRRYNRSR